MIEQVIVEVAALVGFAALVSVLVNIGKFFGVIKDGDADKWVAGANLIGVIALYVTRKFVPGFDPGVIDKTLAEIASVTGFVLSYLLMLFGSKFTYKQIKGLPVIGKSFSA